MTEMHTHPPHSLCLLLSGIIAIANAIPDMGALTKLDISNNNIEHGQALQQITEFCSTKGVELGSHESNDDDGSGGDY
jgi:hypothetical protein